jgi:hypothetical protein
VTFDYWPDGALREQIETKPDATVVTSHLYEYDLKRQSCRRHELADDP